MKKLSILLSPIILVGSTTICYKNHANCYIIKDSSKIDLVRVINDRKEFEEVSKIYNVNYKEYINNPIIDYDSYNDIGYIKDGKLNRYKIYDYKKKNKKKISIDIH